MTAVRVAFDVEQAGCESCGRLITAALTPHGSVETLTIDEQADLAGVVLSVAAVPEQSLIDEELAKVSIDAGHRYRVRPGSWRIV